MTDHLRPARVPTLLFYFSATLLLTLPLAVLVVRSGHWQQGLLLYALACLLAAITALVLAVLAVLPRYRQQRSRLFTGLACALPGTLLFLSVVAGRGDYPAIHDITTDLSDPPTFSHAQSLRGPDSNPLDIKPDSLGAQQDAYPDLQSLRSERSANNAFRHALAVADQLGWEITWQDADAWQFEAVDTTAIMAFKDDIAVRIRSTSEGSVIDLRSVSRVGVGDIGANAKRIRAFQTTFAEDQGGQL
tara:strand:- start:20191 stop:20928 length:738 start_codon:yes stop_codon:yes gene_type:complete